MCDDDDARTIWCGNLSEKITYDVLYELFYQAGPLDKVRIPKDREGRPRNFAFITYTHCESVPYAMDLFKGTALYDRKLSLKFQRQSSYNNGNSAPSPDVAMLLGRPLAPQIDAEVEQKFIQMTNMMLTNGSSSINYGDPSTVLGNYDQHQLTGRLSVASLQGQWTSRHNPDRMGRRHEPYRDRERGGGRRGDHGWNNRDRNDWNRNDRERKEPEMGRDNSSTRDDLRQHLERFRRTDSRDYRDRSKDNYPHNGNYNRNNRNHSRD